VFEKNKYLKSTQTQQLELELIAYNEDCQNWQELRKKIIRNKILCVCTEP